MSTRRRFLQHSALVSLTPLVPLFLSRSALAADVKPDERLLVVIQLDGGNDGLNTVIPFADENYARFRRELRIKPADVLKINDAVGLHPSLKAAAELIEEGRLAIVQGVGYPNPNRSHFESMAIWHHARLASDEHDGNGWLGQAAELASSADKLPAPDSYYVGPDTVPVALRGRRANSVSLQAASDFALAAEVASQRKSATPAADLEAFVQRTVDQSFAAARRFRESAQPSDAAYPGTRLGDKLKLVSRLIKLGGGTRIFYVSQPGYDTHAAQLYSHADLLREFAGGLKAFLNDLKAAGLEERVVVLAFSEFGRRVEENGSAGTDHGAAGPVFVAGGKLRAGLIGQHPSLTDLDQGDLKMAIDFRQVYATLLDRWLEIDASRVLGGEFDRLEALG